MKTKNKVVLLALCMVALIAVSVLGTMAYLTSTDTVTNTFTVGQVKIKLDEAKVGADGKALTGADAARVKANSYKLMPGHEYDKDPTVTVLAKSEESYVRMLVTATFDKELKDEKFATDLDEIFTGYNAAWKQVNKIVAVEEKTNADSTTSKYTVITYEYRYNTTVSAETADTKLPALFTGIKIPDNWTNDDLAALGGIKIEIVAEAIQADGFKDANAAWAAFKN